ncbi:ABC transporter permease [Fusibacter paucivorans]|nr:ABC transporter permease [Fusibacter paucivorans]
METKMTNKWERLELKAAESEAVRKSLTYWQDAWRRLKKNVLSMVGLGIIILLMLFAAFGNFFTEWSFSDQDLDMSNLPPTLDTFDIGDGTLVYVHKEYTLYLVEEDGAKLTKLPIEDKNVMKKYNGYTVDGKTVVIDYSLAAKAKQSGDADAPKFQLIIDDQSFTVPTGQVYNKVYVLGTDRLGRDMLARLIYGARISLLIAFIATAVQFFIGVLYGGISGYIGGTVDNIMMRIVDIIATVPLLLYVILLMVVIGPGLKTICIALGSVYWVNMARIVRGQILSIKEQEYVLAARTIGASTWRIMVRHLIPNALGPIIVSLAMMIPNAIFTEAFLSFIGLGVNAPMASWGTLANDAVPGLRSYAYQLMLPSILISLTVLAFNFLGDGLRDALDPRLRK